MMNCKKTTRLLSEAQERPLGWSEKMAIKLHLSMCVGCSNFAEQVASLRQISRAYAKSRVGDMEPTDDPVDPDESKP